MKLAEQLKREILNECSFDGNVVTEYITNFFKEQPAATLSISFHNHYKWTRDGIAIDENTASRRYGNQYGDLITLPESWLCDMVKFLNNNGFRAWEDRDYITRRLYYLRVSLC